MAALTVASCIAGQEDRCDMLLVVRHADAGDKGSWDGPDMLPPLAPLSAAKPGPGGSPAVEP